jgi:hypothetical protein
MRKVKRARLPAAPGRIEERVEGCTIARPDPERDLKRPADLLAIEQIDERERPGRVDLVTNADLDAMSAEYAGKAREMNDYSTARLC